MVQCEPGEIEQKNEEKRLLAQIRTRYDESGIRNMTNWKQRFYACVLAA